MVRRSANQAGQPRVDFSARLVVITGGSSGIGFALAERFVGLGARVVLVADDREKLEAAVETLTRESGDVSSVTCDIGDPSSTAAAMAALLGAHGTPDVLINNAGFAVYRTFEQSDAREIERLINVNFAGHLLCTKGLLGAMISRGNGHVVNIASVAGLFTLTPNAVYGAAKSGIVAWSRALRVEIAHHGIGVSVVCPGRVETPFFDDESFRTRTERRETRLTVPMPSVVDAVLNAIRWNQELVTVPRYWNWYAKALHVVPFALRAQHALLRRRVDDLYRA